MTPARVLRPFATFLQEMARVASAAGEGEGDDGGVEVLMLVVVGMRAMY